ncbi:hypothetical protein NQ176_g4968 [Zarea fungicola]|uniref:Uncharacterized protein n=1 Tax=Zarea fungicola TaxID=93591 RepID=A0ACC1NBG7_9HYPO|nr:hypothetical protein NQ176_g4968 [Lecanicillium fungicola]
MLFFKTAILLVMAGEASVMASIIGPAARDSLGYMQVSNSTSRGDDPEEAVPESDPNKKPLDSNMVHDELEHLCKKIEKLGGECVCKTAEPTTTSTATITSTTSTTTTTSTSVTSTAPCATPTCGSKGAKYFRYNNPFKGDYSDEYDSFDLEYFQSQTPLEEGVASTIYLKTDASNQTFNHAALQYQTFLFACKSGTYTFTSSGADDATLMWFGTDKVKDSTRQNADIAQFWYGDNSPKTVRKTIAANTRNRADGIGQHGDGAIPGD